MKYYDHKVQEICRLQYISPWTGYTMTRTFKEYQMLLIQSLG